LAGSGAANPGDRGRRAHDAASRRFLVAVTKFRVAADRNVLVDTRAGGNLLSAPLSECRPSGRR